MSKIPDFDSEQREFIMYCLCAGGSIAQVTDDIIEMLQLGEAADTRKTVYRRVQKIREKIPEDQIQNDDGSQYELLCLSPQWRIRYLRSMLKRATDDKTRAQLLRDIRTETRLLAKPVKKTRDTSPLSTSEQDLPENYSDRFGYDPRLVPEDIKSLPNFTPNEWHGHDLGGGPWPNECLYQTFLPESEYEYVYKSEDVDKYGHRPRHSYFRRKSDGVLVWRSGIPLTDRELETGKAAFVEKAEAAGQDIAMGVKLPADYQEPARAIYLENYRKKHGG